jgi:uncharacterized protein YcbX
MQISAINIYPVKSLKGIAVNEALVEKRGLEHDRRWMLTDRENVFFTQREFPRMATISMRLNGEGWVFSADGAPDMPVSLRPAERERRNVTVWSSVCEALVYGADVNDWFSRVLETDCQLVYMPDDTERGINPLFDQGNEIVSFADGYPVMALSEASLADLNSQLDAPLPMNRFRPNLVLSGTQAFAEDDWKRIKIGDTLFRSTKLSARCVITTVDQARGEFTGKEPLRTFATYRKASDVVPDRYEAMGMGKNDVLFGQNLVPENPGGFIYVGDAVEVLETY